MYEFETGDAVWFLEGGKAARGTVTDVNVDEGVEGKSYDVRCEDGGIVELEEFEVFPCPEALARDIFEDYEPEDIDIELTK